MKTSRRLLTGLLTVVVLAPAPPGFANPVGESLVAGHAAFNRSRPGQLIINQGSHRAIINWADFSIGRGEVTSFVMPSSSASVLNRVVGVNPSQLFGTLQGNGHVYIINPNGVFIGRGGMVNTRSLTASTLDVSDTAYLAGAGLRFSGASTASVKNDGNIRALGGDVFLIAHNVENSGRIEARQGKVGLAAGSEVLLQPAGNDRLSVVAGNSRAPKGGQGINNAGTIQAVSAELKAAGGNIYSLAINNGGVIRATGLRHENGRVVLVADGGDIENSGAISAQNANGSGGSVRVSAGHNADAPATVLNSGTITARGEAAGTKGGEVRLLGDQVGLGGHALVDVSGRAGGGTALIGGDAHGANRRVQNAERTFIGADAQIRADAIDRGDGGRVIVWADGVTRFFGSISALGGARGGDGGFAEVSGKQSLLYAGTSDLRAPQGLIGDLLLDPKNITVSDTGDPFVAGDYDFSDNPGTAVTIRNTGANSLVSALDLADVTLQANNDIQITHAVDASGNANDHGLTLQAGRQILIDANVTLRGSFTAVANHSGADLAQRDAGPASFRMGSGVGIDTSIHGPHAISISYDNGVAAAPANQSGIDNMVIGALNSGGGGITLHSADANEFDVVLDLQGAVASGGGNINLTAGRLNLDGSLNSGSGLITVTAVNGRNLILGADAGIATLSIDDGELSRLTTSGGLKLVTTLDALLAPGSVTVSSATGPALMIASLGSVTFDDGDSAFDSLTVDAGASIHLGVNITTSGSQTYLDALELQGNLTLQGTDLALGAVAGSGFSLTLSGSGATTLGGAISGVMDLTSGGGGSTAINGGTISTMGSQQYDDDIRLGADAALTGSGVVFNGALDSAAGMLHSLRVNASGLTAFQGPVGGSDRLSALTTDAAGSTVLAGSIRLNGAATTFDDQVLLTADTTIDEAGAGSVTFNNTVDSVNGNNFALTVNTPGGGETIFNGAIGANSLGVFSDALGLGALTTDAAGVTRLNAGSVRTKGNQNYQDAVTLGADATLTGADVSFQGALDSAAGTLRSLTANASGVTRFNGAVGGTDRLSALTTDAAGRTEVASAIRFNGPSATFNDAVLLTGNATIDQAGTGDITFNGTVDSAVGNNFTLTVNTSGGGATVLNGTAGNDALGSLSDDDGLGGLTTDAAGVTRINGGNIRTTGSQNYNDAVLLGADTTLAGIDISFLGALDSAMATLHALTVNAVGATRFNGIVGGTDRLSALATDAAGRTELGGASVNVNGIGGVTFNDRVLLTANTAINQAGAGSVTFNHSVDSAAGSSYTLAVNTPAGASTVFNGAVGSDALGAMSSDTGLGGLTTDASGTTALNGGSVRTSADQTYNDPVTLGADTTLSGDDVLFNHTLNSAPGQLRRLTVNAGGVTSFNAQIGAIDRLASLTTDAGGRTELGAGTLDLNGATATAFNDPVLLNANLTINQAGAGNVTFASVDSRNGMNFALTINTPGGGNTVFNGAVGGDALGMMSDDDGLGSFTTDGVGLTSLNGPLVRTTGAQSFADEITLGASVTLNALSVTLSRVNGAGRNLTVTADAVALTPGQSITVTRLSLAPRTDGIAPIDLGTAQPFGFSLTQAELDVVTADVLHIGSVNSGLISLTAPITLAPARVPTLRLESIEGIDGSAAGLSVANLAIQTGRDVRLTGDNRIGTIAARFGELNPPNFSLCNSADLTVGSVDGINGIVQEGAAPGNITLIADNLTVTHSINAGSGRVTLSSKTDGRPINLGSEAAGSLSLTAAELARIKADTLKIGNSMAGAITISDGLDFGVNDSSPNVRTLSLESAQSIAETPAGWIQVKNLGLRTASASGAVLDSAMNDWLRLGAEIPNGSLVVREMGGYSVASGPPNDIDGLTGVSSSNFDPSAAALEAIAAVTYTDVPLFWPTLERVEFAAPIPRPAGFEEGVDLDLLPASAAAPAGSGAPDSQDRGATPVEHPFRVGEHAGSTLAVMRDAPMPQNVPT